MRKLFKEKVSKFGSLISLIAVTALLVLFSLALPEFLASTAGRIFAGLWAVMAIAIFIAHARRMTVERKKPLPAMFAAGKKDVRSRKPPEREQRVMRG